MNFFYIGFYFFHVAFFCLENKKNFSAFFDVLFPEIHALNGNHICAHNKLFRKKMVGYFCSFRIVFAGDVYTYHGLTDFETISLNTFVFSLR